LAFSSAFFVAMLALGPATLSLYGSPYEKALTVYALLLVVQWANGVGRPAIRHAVVEWDARRIGVSVGSSAVVAVVICSAAVAAYGALAAAAASVAGSLILNSRAIAMALADARAGRSPPDPCPPQFGSDVTSPDR
jgi:hypothetical protein